MLLVGTTNRHKLQEIRDILGDLAVKVTGTEILPVTDPVAEDGQTFAENAQAKALEFARRAA